MGLLLVYIIWACKEHCLLTVQGDEYSDSLASSRSYLAFHCLSQGHATFATALCL